MQIGKKLERKASKMGKTNGVYQKKFTHTTLIIYITLEEYTDVNPFLEKVGDNKQNSQNPRSSAF